MKSIERNWNGMPTIVSDKIEENTMIENTLVGFGTMIADKDFISDMEKIALEVQDDKNLITLLTNIYNKVNDYFYSDEVNDKTRSQTYDNNSVVDEDGLILGTKISSLKGKNIAKCSEKSIAGYIILEKLFSSGKITRKPSFVLSNLKTDSGVGPHAFVMIDKECNDPTKHLLFDLENPTIIETETKEQKYFVGLYSLSDKEYDDFISGHECSPKSLCEYIGNVHEIGEKRTYGNVEKEKII